MSDRGKVRSMLVAEVNDFEARILIWGRKGGHWVPTTTEVVEFTQTETETAGKGANGSAFSEERRRQLVEALRGRRLKAQYNILLLPKQAVTSRLVNLPATDGAEVARMARFEAERQIPFNAERYIVSHHVVEKQGIEGSRVLIAAIDGDILQQIVAPFEELGIRFQEALDTSLGLFNLMPGRVAGGAPGVADSTTMTVHIDRGHSEIVLSAGGRLRFSRSIAIGWETLAEQLGQADRFGKTFDYAAFTRVDALEPEKSLGGSRPETAPTSEAETAPPALPAVPIAVAAEEPAPEAELESPFALDEVDAQPVAGIADDSPADGDAAPELPEIVIEIPDRPARVSGSETSEIRLANGTALTIETPGGAAEGPAHPDSMVHETPLPGTLAQTPPPAAPVEAEAPSDPEEAEPLPGDSAQAVRQWQNRLLGQLRRTWDFAQREETYPPLTHICLSGAAASWTNLDQYLQVNLGCETLRLDAGWKALGVREPDAGRGKGGAALDRERWNAHAGCLTQVANDRPLTVNLLSDAYLGRQLAARRHRAWALSAVLALLLIGAGFLLNAKLQQNLTEEYKAYVLQNRELEKGAGKLVELKKRIDILEKHVNEERSALKILDTLNTLEILPESITLLSFDFRRNKDLALAGHALEITDIDLFAKALRKTGLFDRVIIITQTPTQLRGRSRSVYKFNIKCDFPGVGEDE